MASASCLWRCFAMATRCRSITSCLCRWSPGCCRSTAGSVFCFAAAADYHSDDDSGSRPACSSDCGSSSINCGFLWFITVGHFFLIGRAVPTPSVAQTPSSFCSASCHGRVHCGFPHPNIGGAGPVYQPFPVPSPITRPGVRSVCNPFPVAVPVFHPLQLMGPVFFLLGICSTVAVTALVCGMVAGILPPCSPSNSLLSEGRLSQHGCGGRCWTIRHR